MRNYISWLLHAKCLIVIGLFLCFWTPLVIAAAILPLIKGSSEYYSKFLQFCVFLWIFMPGAGHKLTLKEEKIQWDYNFSHIDRDIYIKETNIILEQYKNAVNVYPEYKGLDIFVVEYKLQDCT